ncbi:addiction module toxin, HicA family [bacterium]|nr:addiction module toxin, HicA family [bacterium]
MTRLPAVTARELITVAERIGFVFDRQKGSHAVYVRTTEQGCTTIVVPVHKGRTLKHGTLHGLIDDMGLTREEFIDLL